MTNAQIALSLSTPVRPCLMPGPPPLKRGVLKNEKSLDRKQERQKYEVDSIFSPLPPVPIFVSREITQSFHAEGLSM